MKPRVYVETSVFSYLTARESASRLSGLGLALPFICPPEDLAGEDDE